MSSFPFTVDELVKMSATLRDVCVGFVELAHPDMRMAAYMNGSSKTIWAHCFKVRLSWFLVHYVPYDSRRLSF